MGFNQYLLATLPGILVAGASSIMTYLWARKQFRSERWWERKAEVYSIILESMYYLQDHADKLIFEHAPYGGPIAEAELKSLSELSETGRKEISRIIGIGSFIISAEALNALKKIRKEAATDFEDEPSFLESLFRSSKVYREGIETMNQIAKRDLGVQ